MIHQIAPVPTKTEQLPTINKALLHARHIQAHVKEKLGHPKPATGIIWSPLTAGPFIVPVTRWIE